MNARLHYYIIIMCVCVFIQYKNFMLWLLVHSMDACEFVQVVPPPRSTCMWPRWTDRQMPQQSGEQSSSGPTWTPPWTLIVPLQLVNLVQLVEHLAVLLQQELHALRGYLWQGGIGQTRGTGHKGPASSCPTHGQCSRQLRGGKPKSYKCCHSPEGITGKQSMHRLSLTCPPATNVPLGGWPPNWSTVCSSCSNYLARYSGSCTRSLF